MFSKKRIKKIKVIFRKIYNGIKTVGQYMYKFLILKKIYESIGSIIIILFIIQCILIFLCN